MSEHHYPSEHPRSSDLPLSAENEELNRSLLEGLGGALRSDFVDIYEIIEPEHDRGSFKIPERRYLAKIVFMKLALADIDSESLLDSEADYHVAVIANAYGLSAKNAAAGTHMNENDIRFSWPDTVGAYLLDHTYANLHNLSFTYQDGIGEFSFSGSDRGFVHDETPAPDDAGLIHLAYPIDTSVYSGAHVDPDGLKSPDVTRVLETALKKGRLDLETPKSLQVLSETNPYLNYMSDNLDVVRGSVPYFKKLGETALQFTPAYRDRVAWLQYLEEIY